MVTLTQFSCFFILYLNIPLVGCELVGFRKKVLCTLAMKVETILWKVVKSPVVRFNLKTASRVHFLLFPSVSEISFSWQNRNYAVWAPPKSLPKMVTGYDPKILPSTLHHENLSPRINHVILISPFLDFWSGHFKEISHKILYTILVSTFHISQIVAKTISLPNYITSHKTLKYNFVVNVQNILFVFRTNISMN
jgi:hypothetical protein